MLGVLLPSLRDFVRAFALASRGSSAFESGGVTGAIAPAMPDRAVVNSAVYEELGRLEMWERRTPQPGAA